MRISFWITLIVAAAGAVLLGFYVQVWLDDTWPMNLVFFGPRLTVLLGLSFGLSLLAFVAAALSLKPAGRTASSAPRLGYK